MASFKLLALFVLLGICSQALAGKGDRATRNATSPPRPAGSDAKPQEEDKKPAWKPATGSSEFSVNVDDNIHGANQHRQETWSHTEKGSTVTGTYAAPGRNGKWLKYEYIGDQNGFRITSTKEVNPEELMADQAQDHQANININSNNVPIKYTVTEEQLKQKPKDKADKAPTPP